MLVAKFVYDDLSTLAKTARCRSGQQLLLIKKIKNTHQWCVSLGILVK